MSAVQTPVQDQQVSTAKPASRRPRGPRKPKATTSKARSEEKQAFIAALAPPSREHADPNLVYPEVFTTSGNLSAEWDEFDIDEVQLVDNFQAAHDSLSQSSTVVSALAECRMANRDTSMFRNHFIASAILCTAQHVAYSHESLGRARGDVSALVGPEIKQATSVWQVAAQYGAFTVGQVGRRFDVRNYDDAIVRLVRLASMISRSAHNANLLEVARANLVPVRNNDHNYKYIMLRFINEALKRADTQLIVGFPLKFHVGMLFTGAPVPINVQPLIAATVNAALAPNFNAFITSAPPVTNADWANLQPGLARIMPVGVLPSANILNRIELNFFEWKMEIRRILDEWAKYWPIMSRSLHFATGKMFEKTEGSQLQLGRIANYSGVMVLQTYTVSDPHRMSLAAVAPPGCVESPVEAAVTASTSVNIADKRANFFMIGAKPP